MGEGRVRVVRRVWCSEKWELEMGGCVTSRSECHLYRAMRYTLLAAMTGAPALSGIVYLLDRDLAVMYG